MKCYNAQNSVRSRVSQVRYVCSRYQQVHLIGIEMKLKGLSFLLFNVVFTLSIHSSNECPQATHIKAKGLELSEPAPITIDKIKSRLKESGVFDSESADLTDRERKELGKLFDAVKIMMTSRARQPSNVQSIFASLRLVERAVKKQLKEGQISESLAFKFNWDKMWRAKYDGALSLSLTDQNIEDHPRRAHSGPHSGPRANATVLYLHAI